MRSKVDKDTSAWGSNSFCFRKVEVEEPGGNLERDVSGESVTLKPEVHELEHKMSLKESPTCR